MEASESALYGKVIERADRSPRKLTSKSGQLQIPSGSKILDRLYNDNGVRVRMLRRGRPNKVPTVKELIDHLSKKQGERMLDLQAKGSKVEKPAGYTGVGSNRDSMMNTSSIHSMMDGIRCASETPRTYNAEIALQTEIRCLSERPTRFDILDMAYHYSGSKTERAKVQQG